MVHALAHSPKPLCPKSNETCQYLIPTHILVFLSSTLLQSVPTDGLHITILLKQYMIHVNQLWHIQTPSWHSANTTSLHSLTKYQRLRGIYQNGLLLRSNEMPTSGGYRIHHQTCIARIVTIPLPIKLTFILITY